MPTSRPTGMSDVTARHFQKVSRDIEKYSNSRYEYVELTTIANSTQIHHHESNAVVQANQHPIAAYIAKFLYNLFL
jgi:hypothetical protein